MHIRISLVSNLTLNNFEFLDQICPGKIFMVKNRKTEHHHWISKIQISLGTKFPLKLTILFFFDQICRKRVFGLKQKKWAPYIFYISLHIQISLVQNFNSNWQFWFFGTDLHKKVFPVENTKSEHHHGILHIWISLDIKFQLKLKFWVFGPNLPKKVFQVENRTSNPWRRSVCFLCSKRWFNCCF